MAPHPAPSRPTSYPREHHLPPRPPATSAAQAPSVAAIPHRDLARRAPPQPPCFGSLSASILIPDSHLPLFPSAPWPPPSSAQSMRQGLSTPPKTSVTVFTKLEHPARGVGRGRPTTHAGCSTICPSEDGDHKIAATGVRAGSADEDGVHMAATTYIPEDPSYWASAPAFEPAYTRSRTVLFTCTDRPASTSSVVQQGRTDGDSLPSDEQLVEQEITGKRIHFNLLSMAVALHGSKATLHHTTKRIIAEQLQEHSQDLKI